VNAPSTGGTVRLDYLTNPYWAKRFDGIRRVAPPKSAPTPFDAPTYLASPAPPPVTPSAPVNADAFEPPPSTLSAAQRQSQSAGATTPAVAVNAAPDPIQAAADAFEPPPPTARAARQQAQAASTDPAEPPVRVMRASTGSLAAPRPAQNDDPIARFATGTTGVN
jgi:hypothetical protein